MDEWKLDMGPFVSRDELLRDAQRTEERSITNRLEANEGIWVRLGEALAAYLVDGDQPRILAAIDGITEEEVPEVNSYEAGVLIGAFLAGVRRRRGEA